MTKLFRQFKKRSEKFFKSLGCLSFFLLVFLFLGLALAFRWFYFSGHQPIEDNSAAVEQALKEKFVNQLVPTAQALQREFGVFASVSLAQAMLESDFGRSQLAADHKNLYGVKTSADDPRGALYPTLEYVDDEWIEINDYFKAYPSWQDSMREHALLMINGTTWNPDQYQSVLAANTYQEQAHALQESGYATDPGYGEKLITMIEDWQLYQYDQPINQ